MFLKKLRRCDGQGYCTSDCQSQTRHEGLNKQRGCLDAKDNTAIIDVNGHAENPVAKVTIGRDLKPRRMLAISYRPSDKIGVDYSDCLGEGIAGCQLRVEARIAVLDAHHKVIQIKRGRVFNLPTNL